MNFIGEGTCLNAAEILLKPKSLRRSLTNWIWTNKKYVCFIFKHFYTAAESIL